MSERTDEQLVSECLEGSQDAWISLIYRYRQLVYSVIRSYRLPDQDSADIFQSVCLELFNNLPRLRNVGGLRRWLVTVSSHQCFRLKKSRVYAGAETSELDPELVADGPTAAEFEVFEREQLLRDAMVQLSPRCSEMIRMLFLTDPPMPYAEVASHLGLAEGSIGFIRKRCLDKLKALLKTAGF